MSLTSGIILIAVLDLLITSFFLATLVIGLRSDTTAAKDTALAFFFLITDGIVAALFLVKTYYGVKFMMLSYCFAPKMTDEIKNSKDPNRRYTVYVIKLEKRLLNSFYMISVMVYCFMLIQSISLIFTYGASTDGTIKIVTMASFAIFSMIYTQRKILELLHEKDQRLIYKAVIKQADSEDESDVSARETLKNEMR
jgi:hypothetical protein